MQSTQSETISSKTYFGTLSSVSTIDTLLDKLRKSFSGKSRILTAKDADFEPDLARWSNLDTDKPAAIIQPASEQDVVLTVRETAQAGIPFVLASGGHSPWSTIDQNGIVLDLRRFKEVDVDPDSHTTKVRGGLLMKELQTALDERGQWTAVANGNTVGVIPYMIGGGISSYTPLVGYACENIVAARMITPAGDIVDVSESQHPDLLWAIRGAGQFLGLIIELTIRTYDLSQIGPDGVRQIGMVFFPVERAREVCQTLAQIVEKDDHASAGHFMVMNDPEGKKGRVLMVAPQYFGSGPQLQATFKPLIDLGPLSHQHMDCNFEKHSDHLGWMLDKEGHKRFSQTGMKCINPSNFVKLVDLHQELLDSVSGTERSVFTLEWHTTTPSCEARNTPTAFGCKGVDIWLNILTWYEDASLHDKVLKFDQRAQELMRSDTLPEAYVAYTNTSRDDPIEYRYKGVDTVKKLKALKHKWDPQGVFTTQLM